MARKNRLPDAIVIEHPFFAGGHLGATRLEDLDEPRFDFEAVIPGAIDLFRSMGIDPGRIPLIAAGGINSHERLRHVLALGASAAQVGTPFAVTEEGDAHPNFKKVLAGATADDIVTFMSDAGLPARAVCTPWLARYLKRADELQQQAGAARQCVIGSNCLIACGFRDGNPRGTVLHCGSSGGRARWRRRARTLLPRRRAAPLRPRHPARQRAGRLSPDGRQAGGLHPESAGPIHRGARGHLALAQLTPRACPLSRCACPDARCKAV